MIAYVQNEYGGYKSASHQLRMLSNIKLQQQKTYSGTLTDGAKKRLRRCIELLIQTTKERWQYDPIQGKEVKHRLSFITLTVSQSTNITAREAYDTCFVHFLQWLRRTMKVKTYVWKVEVQKRGQIHYHITTPSWIHYQEIRDKWNNLQRAAGYTAEYFKKTGHHDPNSTDIHKVKNMENWGDYIIKEIVKSIQNPNTTGKVWDASNNLKRSTYYSFEFQDENGMAVSELAEKGKVEALTLEQCEVWKGIVKDLRSIMTLEQMKAYDDHISSIRTKS